MPENHDLLLGKRFVLKSPPPWKIKGEAILMIFKFNEKWVEQKGNVPKRLQSKFRGGLGFLLLGDYLNTPVGPFRELIFVPGKFYKTRRKVITKSFSSTEASTQNGRANWGIPKETLPIQWEREKSRDSVRILKNGELIFTAEFNTMAIPFPLSTALFPLRLCQTWNRLKYFTRLTGFGWGKLIKINKLDLDPHFFPDIRSIAPIVAIKLSALQMTFPDCTFRNDFG